MTQQMSEKEKMEYEKYANLIKELYKYDDARIAKEVDEIMERDAAVLLPDGRKEYLFSRAGAIRILFRNLGGVEPREEPVTVEKIMDNMQGLLYARVIDISEPREVHDRKGAVLTAMDITVGDATGSVTTTVWEDKVEEVRKNIKKGDIIEFSGSYFHKGYLRYASMRKVSENEAPPLPPAEDLPLKPRRFLVTMFNDIEKVFECRATVVAIARTNYVFKACPQCGKKIYNTRCEVCNMAVVTPVKKMRVPLVIDDGTARVRAILWDNLIKKITKKGDELIVACEMDATRVYDILKTLLVGQEFIITGQAQYGDFGKEIHLRDISPVTDIKKEIKLLEMTK